MIPPVTAQTRINKSELIEMLIWHIFKFALHLGMMFIMNDYISGLCLAVLFVILIAKISLMYG